MPERVVPCRVWIADLGDRVGDPVPRPDHVDLLDQAERARLEKLWRPEDRARFVTAAALLRLVVSAELNTRPEDVTIERSCARCGQPHGKPRIPGSDLHVSVSHSANLAVVALAEAGPVGIDVEAKTRRDVGRLAGNVLSPREVLRDPDDFYVYWCRKEAVVKATGDGLRVPFVDVIVSDARDPARLVSYQGESIDCAVADLAIRPDYASAIAVLAAGTLHVHRQDARAVAGF